MLGPPQAIDKTIYMPKKMHIKKSTRTAPSVQSDATPAELQKRQSKKKSGSVKQVHEPMPVPETDSVPADEVLDRDMTEDGH